MKQGRLDITTCESYFVRLSPEDLQQMQTTVGSNSCLEQAPSKFSIVTRDDKFYYKVQPEEASLCGASHCGMSQSRSLLLYCQLIQFVYLEDALFLGLSSSKNKLCLRDLVRQVVHALQELHELGFAHLDLYKAAKHLLHA